MRMSCLVLVLALALPACSKKAKAKTPIDTQKAPAAAEKDSEPADSAAPTASPGVDREEPVQVELLTAYFPLDSALLDDRARERLANNAKWLEQHPKAKLVIEGHTCELGTTEYNVALGERRAQAVREYLARMGVDSSRLKIISYGEERPADETVLERNRRAEFLPAPNGSR